MTKKSSATFVGLFTLVGLLIMGVALVILGAGKHFKKTHKILLHFEKSAYGLQVGSDVRLGGVGIGRVSSISVIIDTKENRKVIPVIVELTDKELRKLSESGVGTIDFTSREGVRRAVEDGLRAGMKQESLVTGQLYIEFDIVPRVEGFVYYPGVEKEFPVVPTIPTETDELISGVSDGLKKINNLDLEGVINELRTTLNGFSQQVEQLEVKRINDNLVGITEDAQVITKDLRGVTGDQKLLAAVDNLNAALVELRKISSQMSEGFDPLLQDIQKVVVTSDKSLKKIEEAAGEIKKFSDPRSPALLGLKNLVRDTGTTSRTLKELANDLKRNPNTLLRGKKSSQ
jgi:ABC-type transporter Mla subunit MlaD